jgi:cell division protein FtsL
VVLTNRHLLNSLLLLIVMLASLSVVTSQHQARKYFIALQQEKGRAQQMEVEWGQLQLEQGTWAAQARIEKIAAQHLQMQLPKNGQVKFIRAEQYSNDPPPVQAR